ncbi:MAG: alpha/beta hydrolase [Bacteroidales bacterium]|nr:alpha/beta hydrolase [Bacteroidales bacterium]
MKRTILLLLGLLVTSLAFAQKSTYMVAQRDTCDLFMDVYEPAVIPGDTLQRPTILFVFGGGFIMGQRDDPWVLPWFKLLNENGYRVVSVDYRLGLKGVPMRFDLFHLIQSANYTKKAVDMGVEDVFAAVRYLADHQEELGVDMDNIVISGSSAGAMISLSSELEACNRTVRAAILPEGFHFAGVMSFAGAIMSDSGKPEYKRAPCPQLLIHGTEDGAVAYEKMGFGRWGMFGSSYLVEKVLEPAGYPYQIYRYVGHTHDMAANMMANWPEEKRFLEVSVMGGNKLVIDCTINDPTMPVLGSASVTLDDIY